MFETKTTLLKNELTELSDLLLGQSRRVEEASLDGDWLSRAGQLGSQIAPLFRA